MRSVLFAEKTSIILLSEPATDASSVSSEKDIIQMSRRRVGFAFEQGFGVRLCGKIYQIDPIEEDVTPVLLVGIFCEPCWRNFGESISINREAGVGVNSQTSRSTSRSMSEREPRCRESQSWTCRSKQSPWVVGTRRRNTQQRNVLTVCVLVKPEVGNL